MGGPLGGLLAVHPDLPLPALNLTDAQVQGLLNQLGIGDLTSGLSQLQLQQILANLGLGSTPPA